MAEMDWEFPLPAAAACGFAWAVLSHGAPPSVKGPGEQLPGAAVSREVCVQLLSPHTALGR